MKTPSFESMVTHGTTTVGMVCTDGVVFTADTRALAGGYFIAHKGVKKILKIDEHLALTIAGGVADAQTVVDILRYHANLYRIERKTSMSIKSAARLVSNVFLSARLFPYIADVIVGGYDESGGAIYNVDLFGSLTEEKFHSTGSGSPVAYGILESEYREDLSTSEAIPIAVKAIHAAMMRNAGTGDSFDVAVIGKEGYRELSAEEKRTLLAKISGSS